MTKKQSLKKLVLLKIVFAVFTLCGTAQATSISGAYISSFGDGTCGVFDTANYTVASSGTFCGVAYQVTPTAGAVTVTFCPSGNDSIVLEVESFTVQAGDEVDFDDTFEGFYVFARQFIKINGIVDGSESGEWSEAGTYDLISGIPGFSMAGIDSDNYGSIGTKEQEDISGASSGTPGQGGDMGAGDWGVNCDRQNGSVSAGGLYSGGDGYSGRGARVECWSHSMGSGVCGSPTPQNSCDPGVNLFFAAPVIQYGASCSVLSTGGDGADGADCSKEDSCGPCTHYLYCADGGESGCGGGSVINVYRSISGASNLSSNADLGGGSGGAHGLDNCGTVHNASCTGATDGADGADGTIYNINID